MRAFLLTFALCTASCATEAPTAQNAAENTLAKTEENKVAGFEVIRPGQQPKRPEARIPPGPTSANVRRLERGMTISEVIRILGPYQSYTSMGDRDSLYQWLETKSSAYSASSVHISLSFRDGKYDELHHYSRITN